MPNRTSVKVGAGSAATTTYDAANRPTSGANPSASYTSDDDGRLTARPGFQYTWDDLGRLTSVKNGSGTTLVTYTYDPLDRVRMADYGGDVRVRFRYVGLTANVAQWLDDVSGTVTRSVGIGWTGERLVDWTGSGSNLRFYGTNAHRDVTWLASSTGAVSQSLRYDAWGTARTAVPSGYTPFRFQGSWFDSTADLSWVVTRWYAPAMGQFLSEDSVLGEPAQPPSRHLYAYGSGEPVGRWDPDGQFWYRVKDGDTLRGIARRQLGDADLSSWIARANPGGRITPQAVNRTWTPRAGMCIWIYTWRNPPHQCGTSEMRWDAKYFDGLYEYYDKARWLIFKAMHRNRVNGAGNVGLFTGGGGIDGVRDGIMMGQWAWLNREGGDWDYKVALKKLNGGKSFRTPVRGDPAPERLYYDVWANIHYGYVGRAHRIPRRLLVWGAREFGGGFDKGDEISVDLGMDLWETFGRNLTMVQFEKGIRARIPLWRRATNFHVIGRLTRR